MMAVVCVREEGEAGVALVQSDQPDFGSEVPVSDRLLVRTALRGRPAAPLRRPELPPLPAGLGGGWRLITEPHRRGRGGGGVCVCVRNIKVDRNHALRARLRVFRGDGGAEGGVLVSGLRCLSPD